MSVRLYSLSNSDCLILASCTCQLLTYPEIKPTCQGAQQVVCIHTQAGIRGSHIKQSHVQYTSWDIAWTHDPINQCPTHKVRKVLILPTRHHGGVIASFHFLH